MPANLEKSAMATGLENVDFHSNPKEGQCQRMFRLLCNCTHSHANKVILKIFQAMNFKYMYWELPDVQVRFRKSRGTRDQIVNIHWILEKAREFHQIFDQRYRTEPLEGINPTNTLISVFWPPELWENGFLLF